MSINYHNNSVSSLLLIGNVAAPQKTLVFSGVITLSTERSGWRWRWRNKWKPNWCHQQ